MYAVAVGDIFINLDSGVPALCAGHRNDVFVCFMFGNTILKRKN